MTAPATPIILLLSGPNLNLLGEREPEVYGTATLDDHVNRAREQADRRGLALEHLQSSHEGQMVDAIHAARERCAAIVINGAAFTHYAWGIHDALAAFEGPVLEVHLSNPASREPWRTRSVITPVATGVIAGLGGLGYALAIVALAELLKEPARAATGGHEGHAHA
jgi:3-dehydroquinate dehydratase-2